MGRPEKWSRSATLQQHGKLRPFVTWDSQKNGREVPRYRREAFLDRFIWEKSEKMVAKCRAVAAWHFATKIPSEIGVRIWQSVYLGRVTAFGRRPAPGASLKPMFALPPAYAAGLGESTRLEVFGWIVIVWKRFAM